LRQSYRQRRIGLEDAAYGNTVGEHIEVVVAPRARRRGKCGRLALIRKIIRKRLGALLLLQDVHDVREPTL
jgi:hypothetical protein